MVYVVVTTKDHEYVLARVPHEVFDDCVLQSSHHLRVCGIDILRQLEKFRAARRIVNNLSDVSPLNNDHKLHQGYLDLSGTKKYAVILDNHVYIYNKGQHTPELSIPISLSEIDPLDCSFQMKTPFRKFHFKTRHEADFQIWVGKLSKVLFDTKKTTKSIFGDVTVILIHKDKEVARVPLVDKIMVGRDRLNDIVIPNAKISRQHCQIQIDCNDRILVTDLGSSAGTMIDNQLIEHRGISKTDIIQLPNEYRLHLYFE